MGNVIPTGTWRVVIRRGDITPKVSDKILAISEPITIPQHVASM